MRFIALLPLLALCATAGCAGVAVRAVSAAQRARPAQMFENADANGDGRISRGEFIEARNTAFTRRDRNGDGYLTAADAPQRMRRRGVGASGGSGQGGGDVLRMMDADGDGRISREEFVNASLRIFDRTDDNHDGVVDAREVAAFHAAAAARRGRSG